MSWNRGNVYNPLRGLKGSTHLHHLDQVGANSATKSVLEYSILCQATDPRDKVYGLLGLFDRPLIPVDYILTVDVVYLRFSQVLIQEARNIHLLHLFGTQRHLQTLPSWVPDFSVSKPIGILPRVLGYSRPVNAVSNLVTAVLPQLRFSGTEMTLRGCNLEKIYALSDELAADAANFSWEQAIYRYHAQVGISCDSAAAQAILPLYLGSFSAHADSARQTTSQEGTMILGICHIILLGTIHLTPGC